MFVVKKNNTKSFRHAKLVENITEDNIDEVFEDGMGVFSLVKLTKEEALEVQKTKDIVSLRKQQEEIAKRLADLGGEQTQLVAPQPVFKPNPNPEGVKFLSEEEKNVDPNFIPATPSHVTKSKDEIIDVPGQHFKIKKPTYPTNPDSGKPYTKNEFMSTYNEFKELAERKEQVFGVLVNNEGIIVQLTEDIKIAQSHRGIPLRKEFI